MVPLFSAAYAAPNKGTTILYGFRSPKTVLNPPVNGKSKDFSRPSSTFQGKFNFQELFKTVLYIQVLFKPVQTLLKLPLLLFIFCSYIVNTSLLFDFCSLLSQRHLHCPIYILTFKTPRKKKYLKMSSAEIVCCK